jgi:hypothetical protein
LKQGLDKVVIDLTDFPTGERRTESAYGRLTGEGAQGGAAPAFAEGLLTQLQQLRDMLHAGQQARMAKR